MTPKEKFEDIDMSKLPSAATEKLDIVKPYLFDKKYQTDEYKEDRADAAEKMNTLYGLIAQKYPESIKSKVAKAPEPKTPAAMAKQAAQQTVKQPKGKSTKATAGPTKRGNITVLAKEIRKEGESWNDARKRAAAMINSQKKVVVKKANKQYQKLKAYLAKHPIRKGATDVVRDAPRKALPIGKRVAKKSGRTYYEYRENRTDRRRSGFPYLRLGGKLHGAGQFAKGGEMKKLEVQVLTALHGFKDGLTMNGLLESMGLSNYRFNQYASSSKTNQVKKALKGLIKQGFVKEGGIGYIITSEGAKYRKENYSKYGKGGTAKKKSSYAEGGMMDDYTKSFGLVKIKFANPKYNYETNVSGDITEAQARKYFVGKMFDVGVYPNENMQKVIDIEFHPKGTYAKGGMIDLFEDYENIPPNVQEILDKYEDAFMDGDYKGLHEALKEVEKKGYTFEYYLDGQAYGLRPIDVPLNEVKGYEEFAKGGELPSFIDVDLYYHSDGNQILLDCDRIAYSFEANLEELGCHIDCTITSDEEYVDRNGIGGEKMINVYHDEDGTINYDDMAEDLEEKLREYDDSIRVRCREKKSFAKGGRVGKIIRETQPPQSLSEKQIRLANEIANEVVKTGLDAIIIYDSHTIDVKIIYGNKFRESLSTGLFRVSWSGTDDNKIRYLGVGVGYYDGYEIKRGWSKNININEVQNIVKTDKNYYDTREYSKGGVTGFEGLSKKVAARYKGKSVPAKYQKEYGKTYDAAEAKEVGNKVAAKVYRQQLAKK